MVGDQSDVSAMLDLARAYAFWRVGSEPGDHREPGDDEEDMVVPADEREQLAVVSTELLAAFVAAVKAHSASHSITGAKKGSAVARAAYDAFCNAREVAAAALNPAPTHPGFVPSSSSALAVAALAQAVALYKEALQERRLRMELRLRMGDSGFIAWRVARDEWIRVFREVTDSCPQRPVALPGTLVTLAARWDK